jgi:wyosine [tRNA(Phe)-imidazoG37] synthetase (radical SAM superfamily)
LRLPLKNSMRLIEKANEEENKEYFYRWWLVRYPLYDQKTYESFNEFYDKVAPKKIEMDTRSTEDIMGDVLEIEHKFKERR